MRLLVSAISFCMIINYILPFLLIGPDYFPKYWNFGSYTTMSYIFYAACSILALSLFYIYRRSFNFNSSELKIFSLTPKRYKFEYMLGDKLVIYLVILAWIISIISFIFFANSLRSFEPGSKGSLGAFGYLAYVYISSLSLFLLMTKRNLLCSFMVVPLVLTANGTIGWAYLLLYIIVLYDAKFKIKPLTFLISAPIGVGLLLLLVTFSKSGSDFISLFSILSDTGYMQSFLSRIIERANVQNFTASYLIESGELCNYPLLVVNQYIWGFDRIFDTSNAELYRIQTFSQCTYSIIQNHGFQIGTGLSLGLFGSLNYLYSWFILPFIMVLTAIVGYFFNLICIEDKTFIGKILLVTLFSIYFLPFFDSPLESIILFEVVGLKFVMTILFLVAGFRITIYRGINK